MVQMDPISAAGFASAVLTFVEFSWKLVKGSYDIYHSDTNTPADAASIGAVLKDLDDVTGTLRVDCHGASHHLDFLKDLAAQCLAVSGELSTLLKDLEPTQRIHLHDLTKADLQRFVSGYHAPLKMQYA